MLWQFPAPSSETLRPQVALSRFGADLGKYSRCSHDLAPGSGVPEAQAVGISERDMIVSASMSHQLFPLFRPVDYTGTKVVGDLDLDWRPVLDRTRFGGGRHEVADDHASCAEHQRKHPPFRFGRIVCMVSEL